MVGNEQGEFEDTSHSGTWTCYDIVHEKNGSLLGRGGYQTKTCAFHLPARSRSRHSAYRPDNRNGRAFNRG